MHMPVTMSVSTHQSAQALLRGPSGNVKLGSCIPRCARLNALGRPARLLSREQPFSTRAMAGSDSDKSERGRLVSDALEFSRSDSQEAAEQQTKSAAPAQRDIDVGRLLGGKYTVVEVLGRGKAGVMYKAERPGGGLVAVKALSLRSMADWKQLELFEREAAALRSLDHAGIPAYVDYFEVDSDGDREHFLVQELVEGKSLAQMVEAGWQPDHQEVARIAKELLSTFSYLEKQKVVHRDVKPENIILEGGKPGGKIFLVDFGGIQRGDQDVADSEVTETGTLVGTYGYMAPEQLRGSAQPASDLFALGGTLLYLLTGEQPSSFPQRRLKVDFSRVSMPQRLQTLLNGLLQPASEDRLTASQAQAVLAGQSQGSQQQQQQRRERQGWNVFGEDSWENARQRARQSDSSRRARQEQESASTSGRDSAPQGVGINNVLLALAAAYVLPGPLFPLVALTLPFWLSGKSKRRTKSSPSSVDRASDADEPSSGGESADSHWMQGNQRQQQRGFGFSDGPAKDAQAGRDESEMTTEEQEARSRRRRQQQMAAFQQQQMLFNMMRMMGGGMGGHRGGFGGPFGIRGGFRRGPFMF